MFRSALVFVTVALSCLPVACGGGGGEPSSSEADHPGDAPALSSRSGIAPCGLLSAGQVATVLSDSDEGYVAADGGSLIEGVDSYQCSYSNAATDLLTVIVTVAADDARFEDIEPSPSLARQMYPEAFQEIQVGERGWLAGESDDMKLTAVTGRAVIELELMTSDAGEKGDALVALASVVASKVQ